MLVKCDFGVYVGDFLCNCEGVGRFKDEAPFVWYMANEEGYCLIWDIKDTNSGKLEQAFEMFSKEPTFQHFSKNQMWSQMLDMVFQQNIKDALKKISISNNLWDTMGGTSICNRYFPNGIGIALRDISCENYSWQNFCKGNEAQEYDSEYLNWLNGNRG